MSELTIKEKRRQLLDAIYAIHVGNGGIRVDAVLAQQLDRAWEEYDATLVEQLRAALERIRDMAERPSCICGRLTGTAAIKSCAESALGQAGSVT